MNCKHLRQEGGGTSRRGGSHRAGVPPVGVSSKTTVAFCKAPLLEIVREVTTPDTEVGVHDARFAPRGVLPEARGNLPMEAFEGQPPVRMVVFPCGAQVHFTPEMGLTVEEAIRGCRCMCGHIPEQVLFPQDEVESGPMDPSLN